MSTVGTLSKMFKSFVEHGPELGLNEIIRLTSMSKGSIYRLLTELKKEGYIAQNMQNKKYRLGVALIELGNFVLTNLDLSGIAHPYLVKLSEQTGETVHLGIYDKRGIIYISKVESSNAVKINSWVGKIHPAYCTAMGKVLLAFNRERLADISDLKPLTKNTLTTKAALADCLDLVQNNFYAVDDEEIYEGVRCIAAPIFDSSNDSQAAIGVSGPIQRISEERMKALIPDVLEIAQAISKQLGYENS